MICWLSQLSLWEFLLISLFFLLQLLGLLKRCKYLICKITISLKIENNYRLVFGQEVIRPKTACLCILKKSMSSENLIPLPLQPHIYVSTFG